MDVGQASNFETKELLFSKKLFNCTHTVNEQCNSAKCGAELSQAEQVAPVDVNQRKFQTLLCSLILSVDNPHCLRQGALNEEYDED